MTYLVYDYFPPWAEWMICRNGNGVPTKFNDIKKAKDYMTLGFHGYHFKIVEEQSGREVYNSMTSNSHEFLKEIE